MKKWIVAIIFLAVAGTGTYWFLTSSNQNTEPETVASVAVTRGSIVDKALAVGTIEPEHQIEVKSKVSGVVSQIYAQPGTFVRQGDPLIEVQPDPTPLELAEARRNVELSEIQANTIAQNIQRQAQLLERGMIAQSVYEELERQYNDALVRLQMNRERLQLLESGRVTMDGVEIESVIKAPISGFVLERMVDIGDPVVPLTSYQAGTALMTIADMDGLIFKGTVDEIDVGKLTEGMPVELKIGALPDTRVTGVLRTISLKAIRQDNTTVFPVEIDIIDTNGAVLRAGYSANADIIIKQLEDILLIPERVIVFRDNETYVEVLIDQTTGESTETQIQTGSSNAVMIEVREGLQEGQIVKERPQQSLTL